jgi:iron complex outermembrane receptor protein
MNDWWPPVAGSMMMGPDTFLNINNGERTRIGGFGEWEARWSDSSRRWQASAMTMSR